MPFLDDLLTTLGAWWDRTHIFTFSKAEADGVHPRFMRDLRPVPETGLTGGHLLELYAVLDERYNFDASDRFRFDVLEEDWLFSGGLDDRITSLLGQNAGPPQPGAPTRQLNSTYQELTDGEDALALVEEFKRTVTTFGDDYAGTMLIMKEVPDPTRELRGTRRTHVIAWHRIEHDDIGAHSELYFILDVNDGEVEAASPVLEIEGAPLGAAVRLTGTVTDAEPFDVGVPEPLEAIPVTLGGRRALSGQDGTFVLDARLPVGDHQLRFSRSGIDTRDLTVRVTADANDVVTAAVLDGANLLVGDSTPLAATEASLIELALPAPLALRVHKLRGTVRWPDTRDAHADANYLGTPLAERRVYVLPLPAEGALADLRPKTTKQWEALKRRSEVLRSTRPGDWELRRRTADDGRFEVKYVDFTAGTRFLMWVERLDPRDATDTTTETPDLLVRTLRVELIRMNAANAAGLERRFRLLVDHEYNLTRDVVPWGVDAMRVGNLPFGLTLVRPSRGARDSWDTLAQDALEGEWHAVPADRIIDGANQLQLQVLPLVPLGESADARGGAAARAHEALASAAAAAFPDGYDAGAVPLAVDVRRLEQWIDWGAVPGWVLAADRDAQKVELLERTLIVRSQLGRGQRLGVDAARWHCDAVSLADAAFVAVPAVANPLAINRRLNAAIGAAARVEPTHLPVLGALAPMLPGLAPRRVYLAPGHGLFPRDGSLASANPNRWDSFRGGWADGAGEDETDAVVASEMRRIVARNRGTAFSPRELVDFVAAGVANTGAGVFAPQADPDFPRLWQQNPVYYLGARDAVATGNGVVTGHPDRRAPTGASLRRKNVQGVAARVAHVGSLAAAADPVDLMIAVHTNASGIGARGCLVEFLGVETAPRSGVEGNTLGQELSQRALDRVRERTHLDRSGGGVFTMDTLNSESIDDLTQTFDHWVLNHNPPPTPDIDPVCRERVRGPAAGAPPAVPGPPNHSPRAVACYNRLPNPRQVTVPPTPPVPPIGAVPAIGGWGAQPFVNAAGLPHEIPVALAELAFHDQADDAALLSRPWFRRLAAEGLMIAVETQLRASAAAVTDIDVQAVLRRVVGDTPAVTALPAAGATATRASIQQALRDVADPAARLPPGDSLGALVSAALEAARVLSRQALVDLMRDRLRRVAGWEPTETDATIAKWVTRPILGGNALDRPDETPTRAEAGALACTAIGLEPASLATAETRGVGKPAQPLLRRAPAAGSDAALFPLREAELLARRLGGVPNVQPALRPQDVYHVAEVWLGDGAWSRLDAPRGSGSYELEPRTPLIVVVRTAGVPWKTENQGAADELEDIEIRLRAGNEDRELACEFRDELRAASATWILDLPSTSEPVDLFVELWARHRSEGPLRVDPPKTLRIRVRAVPAP